MTDKRKKKVREKERAERLERWSGTPAANPRYKGATPQDVARALLGRTPQHR